MSTFYMVEMHYPINDDRTKFNEFYNKHISMLLTIDGRAVGERADDFFGER